MVWEEAFPFADKRTLDMAKDKGLPCKNAKELAEHCGNDRYYLVVSLFQLTLLCDAVREV